MTLGSFALMPLSPFGQPPAAEPAPTRKTAEMRGIALA